MQSFSRSYSVEKCESYVGLSYQRARIPSPDKPLACVLSIYVIYELKCSLRKGYNVTL